MDIVWREGPRTLGCLYHRVARIAFGDSSVQIDVFVRPQDVESRGIAVTVKRYGDPASAVRCDIHKVAYADRAAVRAGVAVRRLGGPLPTSRAVGDSVRALLLRERASIEAALSEAGLEPNHADLPAPDALWDDL